MHCVHFIGGKLLNIDINNAAIFQDKRIWGWNSKFECKKNLQIWVWNMGIPVHVVVEPMM